MRKNYMKRSL